LAGEKIFGKTVAIPKRKALIDRLNSSDPEQSLDGIVLSNETGGYGFNMTGANHIIFLGSMYSAAYEDQIIGLLLSSMHF